MIGTLIDITQRKQLEIQLLQAQKLESIGQLAAGIAHEINTPAQFVSDNTCFVYEEFQNIMELLKNYAELLNPDSPQRSWDERDTEIRDRLAAIDFDFLQTEIPQALEQSLDGVERIKSIVRAMKDFSHPGSVAKEYADLNRAIESTVTVCSNRWKYVADLKLDLDRGLPQVPCLISEFNQVVLNLIVNAADAIESDAKLKGSTEKGQITIQTSRRGERAEVRVIDSGGGIPQEIKERIFDPFFTTKEVGKGTGQGLAISRDVIVQKHGGELLCESEPGVGTTFIIRVPLEMTNESQEAA